MGANVSHPTFVGVTVLSDMSDSLGLHMNSARADPSVPRPPKLLDQLRDHIRLKHYSLRTERAYAQGVKRYIYFHGRRHPAELGKEQV